MATQKRITQTGAFLVSRQLLRRVDAMAARRGITRPTYCKEAMVRLLVNHALGRVGPPPRVIDRASTDRINGLVIHQRVHENFRSYCAECKRSHNDTMEFALRMALQEDEYQVALRSQRIREGKAARSAADEADQSLATLGEDSFEHGEGTEAGAAAAVSDGGGAEEEPPVSAEVPFDAATGHTAEDVPA